LPFSQWITDDAGGAVSFALADIPNPPVAVGHDVNT
jgi:hypothetical protein